MPINSWQENKCQIRYNLNNWQIHIRYSSVSNRRGEAIGGVYISQFLIEGGANIRGCSCRVVFIKKRVLIEEGMHVGSFSIEKEC